MVIYSELKSCLNIQVICFIHAFPKHILSHLCCNDEDLTHLSCVALMKTLSIYQYSCCTSPESEVENCKQDFHQEILKETAFVYKTAI